MVCGDVRFDDANVAVEGDDIYLYVVMMLWCLVCLDAEVCHLSTTVREGITHTYILSSLPL